MAGGWALARVLILRLSRVRLRAQHAHWFCSHSMFIWDSLVGPPPAQHHNLRINIRAIVGWGFT